MSLNYFISNLFGALFLPPLNIALLAGIGWAVSGRWPRTGRALVVASFIILLTLSMPIVGRNLLALLEDRGQAAPPLVAGPAAIVVLGGGTYIGAPEYGGDTVKSLTLERLRYAARIQRRTGLPVLVTGGHIGGHRPEGRLMREVLEGEFGVPVRWVEDQSENTRQNAIFSAAILRRAGIDTVYLVSHAWHMPRAVPEFARTGLHVVPAPTGFSTDGEVNTFSFLPQARALVYSYFAMHEAVGLVWYRLTTRGRDDEGDGRVAG